MLQYFVLLQTTQRQSRDIENYICIHWASQINILHCAQRTCTVIFTLKHKPHKTVFCISCLTAFHTRYNCNRETKRSLNVNIKTSFYNLSLSKTKMFSIHNLEDKLHKSPYKMKRRDRDVEYDILSMSMMLSSYVCLLEHDWVIHSFFYPSDKLNVRQKQKNIKWMCCFCCWCWWWLYYGTNKIHVICP